MYLKMCLESLKSLVMNEMSKKNSYLRVLMCTIAFGLGIDYKNVYRSVHFGNHSLLKN